jgi:hypothetical protein
MASSADQRLLPMVGRADEDGIKGVPELREHFAIILEVVPRTGKLFVCLVKPGRIHIAKTGQIFTRS